MAAAYLPALGQGLREVGVPSTANLLGSALVTMLIACGALKMVYELAMSRGFRRHRV